MEKPTREQGPENNIERTAETVAQEKLAKLLNDNFRDFAM